MNETIRIATYTGLWTFNVGTNSKFIEGRRRIKVFKPEMVKFEGWFSDTVMGLPQNVVVSVSIARRDIKSIMREDSKDA